MIYQRTCAHCEADFEAHAPNARYCGAAHRNAAYRKRRQPVDETTLAPDPAETPQSAAAGEGFGVRQALLAELQAIGSEGTAMGQALMAVAGRIDHSASETGASLSSMVLRLGIELERTRQRAATAAAVAGTEDEVGKARAKRDRARGAAAR